MGLMMCKATLDQQMSGWANPSPAGCPMDEVESNFHPQLLTNNPCPAALFTSILPPAIATRH